MAVHARFFFFESDAVSKIAAKESTKGDPQNAIVILSRLQPTYAVYIANGKLCTLNGFLSVPMNDLYRLFPDKAASIAYHCDGEATVTFKVPVEDTLKLQTHILLSCGPDFAQQYTTDCFLHHPTNVFVRNLHKNILEKTNTFPHLQHLQSIGRLETRHALRVCARILMENKKASEELQKILSRTAAFCMSHEHYLFVLVWDSVQKELGIKHATFTKKQFKETPSKYSPKTMQYDEEIRAYHPDDFDIVLVLTLMHRIWTEKEKRLRPREYEKFWEALHI